MNPTVSVPEKKAEGVLVQMETFASATDDIPSEATLVRYDDFAKRSATDDADEKDVDKDFYKQSNAQYYSPA